jgi:hypothetical protein
MMMMMMPAKYTHIHSSNNQQQNYTHFHSFVLFHFTQHFVIERVKDKNFFLFFKRHEIDKIKLLWVFWLIFQQRNGRAETDDRGE